MCNFVYVSFVPLKILLTEKSMYAFDGNFDEEQLKIWNFNFSGSKYEPEGESHVSFLSVEKILILILSSRYAFRS